MADHYEVVTNAPGFGSRLMNSIKGIFFGFVFFAAAFPVLWWGEGRQNLAELVEKAVEIDARQAPGVAPGTPVKTTGRIDSTEFVDDTAYLQPHGGFRLLRLRREVEMYAWKEDKKTEKRGDKEVTTYDYRKDWTGHPADSSRFYDPAGHPNPPMGEKDADFQVKTARVGKLDFDASRADFHGLEKMDVTASMVNRDSPKPLQASDGFLYIPYGVSKDSQKDLVTRRDAATQPEVGDLRFRYAYFKNGVDGSVVGAWDGSRIVPHFYKGTESYLGAYAGGLGAFRAQLQKEHSFMTWLIRLAALFMMWLGLTMMLGPVFAVLESVPVVGGAGRFLVSLVCGALAVTLWALTILLANLWLVLLVTALLVVALLIVAKRRKRQAVAPV